MTFDDWWRDYIGDPGRHDLQWNVQAETAALDAWEAAIDLDRRRFLLFTQVCVAVVGIGLAVAVFLNAMTPLLLLLLIFCNAIGLALTGGPAKRMNHDRLRTNRGSIQ